MSGWFACPVDAWEEVAEALVAGGRPWPTGAVLADLAWWADREKMGQARRPGWCTLSQRWRWTQRSVQRAMRGDMPLSYVPGVLREDLSRDCPADVPSLSRDCPADVPSASQAHEDEASQPAENVPSLSRDCPESVLRVSRECPESVPRFSLYTDHTTGTPHTNTQSSECPPAEGLELVPAPVVDLAPRRRRKQTTALSFDSPLGRVWAAYRAHHPRAGAEPRKGWPVAEAVEELGEQTVLLIIEWAHQSDDSRAVHLREAGHTSGPTIFRAAHRATYAELAEAWEARGRTRLLGEQERRRADPLGLEEGMRRVRSGEVFTLEGWK